MPSERSPTQEARCYANFFLYAIPRRDKFLGTESRRVTASSWEEWGGVSSGVRNRGLTSVTDARPGERRRCGRTACPHTATGALSRRIPLAVFPGSSSQQPTPPTSLLLNRPAPLPAKTFKTEPRCSSSKYLLRVSCAPDRCQALGTQQLDQAATALSRAELGVQGRVAGARRSNPRTAPSLCRCRCLPGTSRQRLMSCPDPGGGTNGRKRFPEGYGLQPCAGGPVSSSPEPR